MAVSSPTFDKIQIAFLALEKKFRRHTVAGTVPDVEKEFAALKEHIETAKLEDAAVPVEPEPEATPVANPESSQAPPFFPGAFPVEEPAKE